MKLSKLIVILFTPYYIFSQSLKQDSLQYIFPIKPGQNNYLSGTMGEVRATHFHGGLDIKTQGKTGLPVYATSDGYISRILIDEGGYGKALYLKHTDGNTSLYGHLDLFVYKIERFILDKLYETESHTIDFRPRKDQFIFKKGQIIAYSGNTGSSMGPHLHFEIRDPKNNFINPLHFNFTEIKDNIPPILKSILFVTFDENSRVNQAFGKIPFDVIKMPGNQFTISKPLELDGYIGVEIFHYDRHDGSSNNNGIPEVYMLINGDTIFSQIKDTMSFSNNNEVVIHYDYSYYQAGNPKYNKLFIEENNSLDIYLHGQKFFYFNKDTTYNIKLFLKDNFGNISIFEKEANTRKIITPETPINSNFEIYENFIQFRSLQNTVTLQVGLNTFELHPYLQKNKMNYYIWDLRQGLPDTIKTERNIETDFIGQLLPNLQTDFYHPDFQIEMNEKALFDTLYLRFNKQNKNNREYFNFDNNESIFRSYAKVSLKPQLEYKEKAAVFSLSGNRLNYIHSTKNEDNYFVFKTKSLQKYTIEYDTIPPIIKPLIVNQKRIVLKIYDYLSGIKNFKATLNGEFLLMVYDAKTKIVISYPKKDVDYFKGDLVFILEDQLGNITTYNKKL